MSRKAIFITLSIYLVVSLAFGLYCQSITIPPYSGPYAEAEFYGAAVGRAALPFIGAGLFPMVAWAFMRFRAEKAVGPFMVWGLVAVVVMGLSAEGSLFDRQEKIITAAKNIASLTGRDYDDFVRNARQGCIRNQRKSQLNRAIGISEQQIDAYCQCSATMLAKQVTAEDVAHYFRNGTPSESFRQKADKVAPICRRLALGR